MERIALIRQKYNPAGGAERFVSQALEYLQHQVHMTLIARQWHAMEGIECIQVNPWYWGSLWRDWSFARGVQHHIKATPYALIQSHERIPGCTIYRAGDGVHRVWLTLRRRLLPWHKKILLSLNPYHHFVCRQEAILFNSPVLKKVICNSRMVRNEIMDHFGVPEDKIVVIYNGVDFNKFNVSVKSSRESIRTTLQIPEKAPTLVYVGSGFERKGVAIALKAIAPFPDVHLIVVGGDKHIARYQTQSPERVHFVGPQGDVRPYLGASDGFILPTLYDPFPNAALEALACGLPILTTTTCGTSELLQEGLTGYVRDALDEKGFIQAVEQWQHHSFPPQMIHESIAHLSIENMRDQLIALYHQLIPDLALRSMAPQ